MFDQIVVSNQDLELIKKIQRKGKSSIVLVPTFRSYLDLLMIPYVNALFEIDLPFTYGNKDFEGLNYMSSLLKKVGMFFVDESLYNDQLYKIALEEFLTVLMENRCIISYSLNKERTYTGKLQYNYD